MKNIFTGLFLIFFSSLQAQNVSDYKYVLVPEKFMDFVKEDYQLNTRLKIFLKRKKYEVYTENSTSIPTEVQTNNCLATTADVQSIQKMFTNKLKVVFRDCNENVIAEYEGESKIKEFDKGYQDALEMAVTKIASQNAKPSDQLVIQPKIEKKEEIVKNSEAKTNVIIYKSNGVNYIINNAEKGTFNLVNQENNKVVANFYPSTLQNVYHVEVISENGTYQTIGYIKDNSIIVETKTGDKSWSTTIFTK